MGRQLRTTVPQRTTHLTPSWHYLKEFLEQDRALKLRQKADFDNRHRVKELPELAPGTEVWITSEPDHKRGIVSTAAKTPRSYMVKTDNGEGRRNRSHINPVPNHSLGTEHYHLVENSQKSVTRTQTGVVIKPPERLDL
jgi:hypothetical protein